MKRSHPIAQKALVIHDSVAKSPISFFCEIVNHTAVRFPARFLWVIALIVCLPLPVASQPAQSQAVLQELAANPKVRTPDRVLKNFWNGKERTRVIVTVFEAQTPASKAGNRSQGFANLKEVAVRQQRKNAVKKHVDTLLAGLDPHEVNVAQRFDYLFGFAAEVSLPGLQGLAKHSQVQSIEEDARHEPHLKQGIPLMNASEVRNNFGGTGVAIAICDTGVDYTHQRLGGGGFPNSKVIGGYDTGQNDNDPIDAYGHGTACAGIAAGELGNNGNYIGGVAPEAKIYALKITDTTNGGSAWTSDIIEAWEWAITHQYDNPDYPIMVISTSFGGGFYQNVCDTSNTAYANAAANVKSAGIINFASAGNDGFCNALAQPACLSDVVSVGAVYDSNFGLYYPCINSMSCASTTPSGSCPTGYYASDSTETDKVTVYSNTAQFLDLLAPAEEATTTDISGVWGYSVNNYVSAFGGTSAASPYAAGAAALIQSAYKASHGSYLSVDQLKSALVDNGVMITDTKAPSISKPRIDVLAALNNDSDFDGVPDVSDICPGGDDTVDADGDGVPDFCDPCPLDNPDDSDNDSVCDSNDLCPGYDDTVDADSDTIPDACDNCPSVSNTLQANADSDTFGDACDNCPLLSNQDQANGDGDPRGDVCDAFPNNGAEWLDTDLDGVGDNSDAFILDPLQWLDKDGDGIGDTFDNCPSVANSSQEDSDGDASGDACDDIPNVPEYGALLDAPHNRYRGIGCDACHTYSLWWQYSPASGTAPVYESMTNAVCNSCHDSNSGQQIHQSHSSAAMGSFHRVQLGDWAVKCIDCHDAHQQTQLNWLNEESGSLFLVQGSIAGGITVAGGRTQFLYTTTAVQDGWQNPDSWGRKNSFLPTSGMILVVDTADAAKTYEIVQADQTTLTVKGGLDPASVGQSFGIIYGQLMRKNIFTPAAENRAVRFFNPQNPLGGYTDANNPVSGICQVCHLNTLIWDSSGTLLDDPSHSGSGNVNCTQCHLPSMGFQPAP